MIRTLLALLLLAAPLSLPLGAQPLVIERQGSYFVGGREVRSDALSTVPAYAPSGTVVVDQMYVRFQEPPAQGRRVPLVLMHGCCLTGATWETTPDGRMGWDEFLLRRGHPVHVADQPWRGRSAAHPTLANPVRMGRAAPDSLPQVFHAGREDAWAIFRFGPRWGEEFPGQRFPRAGFGALWQQMVPDWNLNHATPHPSVVGLNLVAQRLNGAVLVSHSQSGIFPFQAAARDRRGIAGIVSIEPGACPAADGDMTPYAGLPVLVLWGDFVEQAPRWAPRLLACRAFAERANAAGGKVEVVVLPEIGIRGNTHMLMQDDNSLELAGWLAEWIAQRVPPL